MHCCLVLEKVHVIDWPEPVPDDSNPCNLNAYLSILSTKLIQYYLKKCEDCVPSLYRLPRLTAHTCVVPRFLVLLRFRGYSLDTPLSLSARDIDFLPISSCNRRYPYSCGVFHLYFVTVCCLALVRLH